MTRLVLDASVGAKWFLPRLREPWAEEAIGLLHRRAAGEVEFLVPDLFWAEIGNIFWKAARIKRWSHADAAAALEAVCGQRFTTVPARELADKALGIALATGRTFYDSLYVALAVQSGAVMLTADEKLAHALTGTWPVRWLGAGV